MMKQSLLILVICVFLSFLLNGCASSSVETAENEQPVEKQALVQSGEDYESGVFDAFWWSASEFFGVEYSDYKIAHTTCSYIQDFETTDGYTSHYYLIQTAFETTMIHEVTARCYYAPEYSDVVYVTYMTLDGETVRFEEVTENWLMGMGDNPDLSKTQTAGNNSAAPAENNLTSVAPTTSVGSGDITSNTTEANTSETRQDTNTPSSPDPNTNNAGNDEIIEQEPVCEHLFSDWLPYDSLQHQRTCRACGEMECENHNWDNGNITKPASCAEDGIYTYTCSGCDTTKEEYLPKTAHDFSQAVASPAYLLQSASYTSGSVYYYSCACGAIGTDTFSLNDRIEWITTDMLQRDYGLSSGWLHESELYIWSMYTGIGEQGNSYLIYSDMRNGMGSSVYYGSYNGCSIRFYNNGGQYVFYYSDLVSAGIIY